MSEKPKTPEKYLEKKRQYYRENKDKIKLRQKKYWKRKSQDPAFKEKRRNYQRELMRKKLGTKPENYRVDNKGEPIKK